ncbi:hypothetical protein [Bythopirellula polymerisocia]|uniref:Uncharacterized protein n=1 Tax=Bythopirellula polymerisocia TaxID=2528003 RepID=A0A5C6CVP0_9BACT|nr:hypothetical protein [Bythopirellula polymerisocia]TWU27895.1 hypothetical protein Pla144_26720 [Bythopirellula polymerisocia]
MRQSTQKSRSDVRQEESCRVHFAENFFSKTKPSLFLLVPIASTHLQADTYVASDSLDCYEFCKTKLDFPATKAMCIKSSKFWRQSTDLKPGLPISRPGPPGRLIEQTAVSRFSFQRSAQHNDAQQREFVPQASFSQIVWPKSTMIFWARQS